MANWTNYFAARVLTWITAADLGVTVPTPPAHFWLALSSDVADETGAFTELTLTGYSRQQVTFNVSGSNSLTNVNTVKFSNVAPGTILAQAIYGASSGGNMLWFSNLSSNYSWDVSKDLVYPAGFINLALA